MLAEVLKKLRKADAEVADREKILLQMGGKKWFEWNLSPHATH